MSADRFQRMEELYHRVAAEPAERRAALLAEWCAGDASLERDVRGLLATMERASEFLETPADPWRGSRLGPWALEEWIGAGGMGRVYRAVRADGLFEQTVAVKVLRDPLPTPDLVAAFHRERQILARLEHPNVARLVDGGTTPDGLPYLVMEFVQGERLDSHCTERRASLEERLALFEQVCAAVQVAHQHQLVHCDLKPSNLLVDARGSVRLVDFGVATSIAVEARERGESDTSSRLTLDYASPELLRGEAVDAASDTYSLGVVLAELVTGHQPRRGRTLAELRRTEPAAPNPALWPLVASEAAARRTTLAALRRRLRGDLGAVLAKALHPARRERYRDAQDLLDDLVRLRDHRPVSARAPTPTYVLSRYLRRNGRGVAGAALLALAITVAFVLHRRGGELEEQVEGLRSEAGERAEVTREVASLFDRLIATTDWSQGRLEAVKQVLDQSGLSLANADEMPSAAKLDVLLWIARQYKELGCGSEATRQYERALAWSRRLHPEPHEATMQALCGVGSALVATHRFEDAVRRFDEAESLAPLLPPSGIAWPVWARLFRATAWVNAGNLPRAEPDLAWLRSKDDLSGAVQWRLALLEALRTDFEGDSARSIAFLRESLVSCLRQGDEDPTDEAQIRFLLGQSLLARRDPGAKAELEASRDLYERRYGPDEPMVLLARTLLAHSTLRERGPAAARSEFESLLLHRGGPNASPQESRARFLADLGSLAENLGDAPLAAELLGEGVACFEAIGIENAVSSMVVRLEWAAVEWSLGRSAHAEELCRRSLASLDAKTLPRRTAQAERTLAWCRYWQGDVDDALQILDTAKRRLPRSNGEHDSLAGDLALAEGWFRCFGRGDLAGAERVALEAEEHYAATLPERDTSRADLWHLRGWIALQQKRSDDAEELLERALDVHLHQLGSCHAKVVYDQNALSVLCLALDRPEDAEAYAEEALAAARLATSERERLLPISLQNLAACAIALEDGRAESLLEERAAYLREVRGPEHAETRRALSEFAGYLQRHGEADRARALMRGEWPDRKGTSSDGQAP